MDYIYYLDNIRPEVYFGYLNRALEVHGDENELLWIDRQQDFLMDRPLWETEITGILWRI